MTILVNAVISCTVCNISIAVKQLLQLEGDFHCVLDEDGSEVVLEILEAIIASREQVGVIMILKDDEEWTPGDAL